MKKTAVLLMILCLLMSVPALAEQDLTNRPIANGVVAASRFVDVTAPYSGTLRSFTLESGDTVAAGDTLMQFVTNDLYATQDGVVKAIFAQVGEDASAAMARYGAIIGLEMTDSWQVMATTDGASSDQENKILHLGETLYFKTTGTNGSEGTGRVVSVTADGYTVDVLTGDFDLDDAVTLYRRDNYASDSAVGKGDVTRRQALLVGGSGRVAQLYVQEGDRVTIGQKLASLVAADAAPDAVASEIKADAAGVVQSVWVSAGQQVWKGQALCRIDLLDAIEVQAEVDEVDLGTVKVGDVLPITLDMYPGSVLMGTVTEVSALGITKQNAAYYTVHAVLPAGSAMLGASASLYLPANQ